LADQLFGNREYRRFTKEQGIRYVGKPLGRPSGTSKKEKRILWKQIAQLNAIEGKFGQGKNAYGLAKIKARLRETSESWIIAISFIMNLLKLPEASFLSFIKSISYPVLQTIMLIIIRIRCVVSTSFNIPIGMWNKELKFIIPLKVR